MSDNRKKKLCIIASAPGGIVSFWRTNIEKLAPYFDVYVVANFTDETIFNGLCIKGAKSVNIERKPSIASGLGAVKELVQYFKQMQFDGFISMSSNASFVAAIAGKIARVQFRCRIFTGQIWANRTGMLKIFLKMIDRFTVWVNTHILVDGRSQQKYLIDNGILKEGQSEIIANAAICGVDVEKFIPDANRRREERAKLGLKDSDVVFIFMGRMNREKGIFELLEAFNRFVKDNKNAKLLLIGSNEGISEKVFKAYPNIVYGENLVCYGYTKTPYYALQAGDVLCLPSYREGFGISVIEASAVTLPVIVSDIYGLRDAYEDGVTGLKCKARDVDSLYEAMKTLYDDKDMRISLGKAGRERTKNLFSMELVSNAWVDYFKTNIL